MYHSQNREAEIVLNYFGDRKGTVLDIGANDGVTFSNSRDLILNGWSGWLFEPGKTWVGLWQLYNRNRRVVVFNYGISDRQEDVPFYESGAHVAGGLDSGLVSSVYQSEVNKWQSRGVKFLRTKASMVPFSVIRGTFEFITIDCEGHDWIVLQQIDLNKVGCECLCIEWNGDRAMELLFTHHCGKYGLKEIHRNGENLIFAR